MASDTTLSPDQARVLQAISAYFDDADASQKPLSHAWLAESLPEILEVNVLWAVGALDSFGYIEISGMERNPTIERVTASGRAWLTPNHS